MSALKYIAYAGLGLAGFFLVKRIVAPPSTAPVTTSPLAGIVKGVQGLVGLVSSGGSAPAPASSGGSLSLFHEPTAARIADCVCDSGHEWCCTSSNAVTSIGDPFTARAQQGTPIGAPLGSSPVANYAVATADGDSAISDGRGTSITEGTTPQPTTFTTYEQRAIAGALPSTLYGIAPTNIARS